ncbi:MAG: exodeoxyribonuclease VII large subunit [Actinomycetota bacterium]|nr:exodeoxyribonuclease VII large subunit [Actinomycetota bacterium]
MDGSAYRYHDQDAGQDAPFTVTQAMGAVKRRLETISMRVIGEVSELSNKPGYKAVYFTLHDEGAAMPCLMWRNIFDRAGIELRAGLLVEVTGFFTAYVPKGRMNFSVRTLKLAGEGNLRMRVAALARKLESEGLMSSERKRAVPGLPSRIAVVTSPRGKAVHDCLRTLRRRFPLAEVAVCGVAVEGVTAPRELCEGLRVAAASGAEVILLVRGGGSYEDLMPFNDEGLARMVAACPVPVVTGIGHEPDNTIADMVADLRCSTPTAAAEAVTPSREEMGEVLSGLSERLASALSHTVERGQARLSRLEAHPLLRDPNALLSEHFLRTDLAAGRLARAIPDALVRDSERMQRLQDGLVRSSGRVLADALHSHRDLHARLVRSTSVVLPRHERQLALAASRLNDLSPLGVLARGYALAFDEAGEHVIDTVSKANPGDHLSVRLHDGELGCEVVTVQGFEEKGSTEDE